MQFPNRGTDTSLRTRALWKSRRMERGLGLTIDHPQPTNTLHLTRPRESIGPLGAQPRSAFTQLCLPPAQKAEFDVRACYREDVWGQETCQRAPGSPVLLLRAGQQENNEKYLAYLEILLPASSSSPASSRAPLCPVREASSRDSSWKVWKAPGTSSLGRECKEMVVRDRREDTQPVSSREAETHTLPGPGEDPNGQDRGLTGTTKAHT